MQRVYDAEDDLFVDDGEIQLEHFTKEVVSLEDVALEGFLDEADEHFAALRLQKV